MNLPIEMKVDNDYLKTNLVLKDIASQYEHVFYLDFSKLPIFQAVPFYNGEVIYRDKDHLNEVGALEYAKQSIVQIKEIIKCDLKTNAQSDCAFQ